MSSLNRSRIKNPTVSAKTASDIDSGVIRIAMNDSP